MTTLVFAWWKKQKTYRDMSLLVLKR